MLNTIQRIAVHHVFTKSIKTSGPSLMLLHGPPGTGKTRTIVGLILQAAKDFAANSKQKVKILVCTPSNTAVDEIIRRLNDYAKDLAIVRIGGGSVSEDVKKFSLEEAAKKYISCGKQTASLNESIALVEKKIRTAKKKVEELKKNSKRNAVEISTCEINILEWQKDRKNYMCDLNILRADKKEIENAKREVILRSQIVFSTLNSCSSGQLRRPSKEKDGKQNSPLFNFCIVDESTQTTEPETLAPLLLGCEKLLLVGDPKQLPATVLSSEADSKKFRQSLFSRLYHHYEDIAAEGGNNPVMMLTQQYRMHPEILKWPNEWFYGRRLTTDHTVLNRPALRIRPYLFLNIDSKESNFAQGQISNDIEVKFLKTILTYLKRQSTLDPLHKDLTIGIITPYQEQKKKVLNMISAIQTENAEFSRNIEVDTVDSFQGREKDIILLTCVRTGDLGFLKTPERLNVAITRAKQSLVIIGNALCLNNNTMWKSLMDDAVERKCYESVKTDLLERDEGSILKFVEKVMMNQNSKTTFQRKV